ncbi:MAG: hypothetical protein ACK5X3_22505 [Pseudomonadota bacterium]|jgi:hypothetical protein
MSFIKCRNEFEKEDLLGKINDLLLHYKYCHDDLYKDKASSVKQEIQKLKADREVLSYIVGQVGGYFAHSEPCLSYSCIFCDLGNSGHSSKGRGYHDDNCLVLQSRQALKSIGEIE